MQNSRIWMSADICRLSPECVVRLQVNATFGPDGDMETSAKCVCARPRNPLRGPDLAEDH